MPLVWLQFKCHAYLIWTNQIIHNNAVRGVPLFAVIPYNSFFCIKQRGGFTSIQTISFYKLDYDGCVLPCLKRQWFNTNRDKYSFVPLRWLIRNVTYYLHSRHGCRRRRQEGYTFCVNMAWNENFSVKDLHESIWLLNLAKESSKYFDGTSTDLLAWLAKFQWCLDGGSKWHIFRYRLPIIFGGTRGDFCHLCCRHSKTTGNEENTNTCTEFYMIFACHTWFPVVNPWK